MKAIILAAALLAPSLAFADGYGYQGYDGDSAANTYNWQAQQYAVPQTFDPPSVFGPLYDDQD